MAKNFRRIFAMIMVVAMFVSVLPMQTLAAETEYTTETSPEGLTTNVATTTDKQTDEEGNTTVTVTIQKDTEGTLSDGSQLERHETKTETEDETGKTGVKEGNETAPATLALVAALSSKQVADFIADKYDGAVVSVVAEPGDGYDASIDYAALAGTTITVAASPTPHAEILAIAKDILAAKDITLVIQEFDDYVQPNLVVDSGEVYANYFQHQPYLDDFNAQNGTKVVTAAAIHVEPMGLYGGQQTTLDALIPAAE